MKFGRAIERKLQRSSRFLLWAIAALFAARMAHVTWIHARASVGIDFYVFWDAAHHVLGGSVPAVYSERASLIGAIPPLGYPPPFLLVAAPLGLFGYGTALALWLGFGIAAYIIASKQPLRLTLANPAAAYNVMFGQTGFLMSSIILGGATRLDAKPIAAGALLGLSVLKPQLAVLVPVALVAGRRWQSLGAAAFSAASLIGLGVIAFGPRAYVEWWMALSELPSSLADGFWGWDLLASPYAFLRWSGAAHSEALGGQLIVSLGSVWIVFESWRKQWQSRVGILAAAMMLVSPYLFAYDAVLLVAPLGFLADRRTWKFLLVWGLVLVPLVCTTFFDHIMPLEGSAVPNTTPIAALLSLLFLSQDRWAPSPACESSRRNWRR